MTNQASDFRRLTLGNAGPAAAARVGAKLLVVSGGRAGVGATTIAVRLARALAHDALRVVLIDADSLTASVAAYCGLAGQPNISDVLAGRKSIHEALQRASVGMQVLAGNASPAAHAGTGTRSLARLRRQLTSLQRHTDWIIFDAGHQATELTSQLWPAADQVLLVTAPDAAVVMDTYALVKTLLTRQSLARPLSLVVNLAEGPVEAADVFRRIDLSCRRFLGISLELAGHVRVDSSGALGKPAANQSDPAIDDAISRLARSITEAPLALAPPRRMAA